MLPKTLTAAMLAAVLTTAAHAEVKKGPQAAAEAAPDDVICTYEKSVGSHIKRRVCATRADRDAQAQADQEAMSKTQRRGKGFQSSADPAKL